MLFAFMTVVFLWIFMYDSSKNLAEASVHNDTQIMPKILKLMKGKWYDHDGNLILQIQDGYINFCKVIAIYDLAGSCSMGQAEFRILKSIGIRKVYLDWHINRNTHDYIKINDEIVLHRVRMLLYRESIAGIHLGMTPREVRQILGSPIQDNDSWYYKRQRLRVIFNGDSVVSIVLYKGSLERLKESRLNCSNTPDEFYDYYHFKQVPNVNLPPGYTGACYAISKGEYLSFANHMEAIMLTIYAY